MPRNVRHTTDRANPSLATLKRQRTARLTKLAARAIMLQRRGRQDEAYTLVCDEFVSLGGIYVKFLQGVLLNSPIIKRWRNADKLRIFEDLPPEPIDILAVLRTQLGPKASQIAQVQTQPFASGSFGQVYYGTLQNGQPIIVKVLRPQIRELLLRDLRLLGLFSKLFMGRQYRNYNLVLDDVVKGFKRATLAETDYAQEAAFAAEFYEAQQDNPDVVVPYTYLDLCTPTLIVQDYIGGISCAEVLKQYTVNHVAPQRYVQEKLGSNLTVQLETLGITLLDGCFTAPRIMGDPHPGNIRLLPDNKIALIDFGISAPAPHDRHAFYGLIREWASMHNKEPDIPRLFEQFLQFFVNDLYRALKKLTNLRPQRTEQLRQGMLQNIGNVVRELFETEVSTANLEEIMTQGRMLQLFNQINRGNRLGLAIKLNDADLMRAVQTYMSMIEALGLRAEVLGVVFATVTQKYRGEFELATDTERRLTTSQALEIVNRWLERVAHSDPLLFRRLIQLVSMDGYDTMVTQSPHNESPRFIRE